MLTRRMQIQAVADRLAGLEDARLQVDDFEEPWQTAYEATIGSPPERAQQALLEALADRPDRNAIVGAILAAVPGTRPDFPSLHNIADTLPPIKWLWPDWIPIGMITLLGAVPGAGKSYVALDLARRIIVDETFPDGSMVCRSGANVIYVDAEVVPQLINERAELWQMDTSRLYLMLPRDKLFIDFSDGADRDHLVEMAYRLDPALIVVDSLSSISTKGENNVEDVRDVLGFLNTLALDAQCGLLLVHHLRKRGAQAMMDVLSIDDFRGSGHIIAISRSVLGLSIIQTGPEPDRNGPRRLEVVKTNLARYPEPIGVEFLPLQPKGVMLRYGEPPQRYQEPTKVNECAEWLFQTLTEAGEPIKPGDIVVQAKEAGFSRATVYRAREVLGDSIRDTESRRHPQNAWELVE
jgi:hypothetical protein